VARNVDGGERAVTVAVDRVTVRELRLTGAEPSELTVPVLPGRPTRLGLSVDDTVLVDRAVAGGCAPSPARAVVLERCGPGDAVLLARGDRDGTELRLRVAGSVVHRTTSTADVVTQRTFTVPGRTAPVQVELGGATAATGAVGACDGPTAGLLSCGSAPGVPPCDEAAAPAPLPPPPAPPPPLALELDPATGLPVTGPWQRALVLLAGGLLLALGGATVLAGDRRLPRSSPLAEALAPYRQRWWREPAGDSSAPPPRR
jgi:hypothetical protein